MSWAEIKKAVNEDLSGGIKYQSEGTIDSKKLQLPFPDVFRGGGVVVLNNEIHILYAFNHYKWNGLTWSKVSTLPYYLSLGSVIVYENEIHILGDLSSDTSTNHYKWNGSSWIRVSTLPRGFGQGSAVVYENKIHILGGYQNNNMHYVWNGTTWTQLENLPNDLNNGCAVVYQNKIHILGGTSNPQYFYRLDGTTWTKLKNLSLILTGGSACVVDNYIYAVGSNQSSDYKHAVKYDGVNWVNIPDTPYPVGSASTVNFLNKLHVLGNEYSTNETKDKHYFYDEVSNTWKEEQPVLNLYLPNKTSVYYDLNNTIVISESGNTEIGNNYIKTLQNDNVSILGVPRYTLRN